MLGIPLTKNKFEPISNYQFQDLQQFCAHFKLKKTQRSRNSAQNNHRIVLLGDSQVRGCSGKLSDILGSSYNIFGITTPNVNINLKEENLTKKVVVTICSGTRAVAKNEANDGLRILCEFAITYFKHKCDCVFILICRLHHALIKNGVI